MITPEELLNQTLVENVTLLDVFNTADGEGQLGTYKDPDGYTYSQGCEGGFYVGVAKKLRDVVINSLIKEIDSFAGDPADIAGWLEEQIKD